MDLVLISGLSGSGKSIALNMLEDLGYYCIDNLPASLLGTVARSLAESDSAHYEHAAIGIDARSVADDFKSFPDIAQSLSNSGISVRVVFLQTETPTLLKRFSETRRKHPLTGHGIALSQAISDERILLEPIAASAQIYIDTTQTNLHQLRQLVRERITAHNESGCSLVFESFGYKNGVPSDVDFVFDARCLPNPFWNTSLRPLTGRDDAVIAFLDDQPLVNELKQNLTDFLRQWIPRFTEQNRSYLTVAIGCTGGQHRSVYLCEKLAAEFRQTENHVMAVHRELG